MEFDNVRAALECLLEINDKKTLVAAKGGKPTIDDVKELNRSVLTSICDLLGMEDVYLE